MGLISAGIAAVTGTVSDLWKEYFYCDSLASDVLVVKGQKRAGRGGSNRGNDNVITNGSGIVVADGQCMIIVDQGKITEVCAEPGEFTYDASSEPSVFGGSLSEGIMKTFEIIGKRFTYGGQPAVDQRVYYFNTKELIDNKFGTANPIPFRVVDRNIGLDIDVSIRCNGLYSYRIADPLLFYANVCGNVERAFTRSDIDMQLRSEFISALQPAFARISAMEIRPSAIPAHVTELCDAMNEALNRKWGQTRGLEVVSVSINSVTLPEEDQEMIKNAQKSALLRDPAMKDAYLAGARADAMKAAASNSGGAMTGFVGMNMADQFGQSYANAYQGGMNPQGYRPQSGYPQGGYEAQGYGRPSAPANSSLIQGAGNAVKIQSGAGWTCSCGTVNKGKFCYECGRPKPAGALLYRCDKCGWEPADPAHPPKFCPECGDPFNDNDIVQR